MTNPKPVPDCSCHPGEGTVRTHSGPCRCTSLPCSPKNRVECACHGLTDVTEPTIEPITDEEIAAKLYFPKDPSEYERLMSELDRIQAEKVRDFPDDPMVRMIGSLILCIRHRDRTIRADAERITLLGADLEALRQTEAEILADSIQVIAERDERIKALEETLNETGRRAHADTSALRAENERLKGEKR